MGLPLYYHGLIVQPLFWKILSLTLVPGSGPSDGNVIFKYKGAEYSKNEYFFGIKSEQTKKTAYQMFLEDDGPYSRKLFGPIANKPENQNEKLSFKNFVYKSKRHFTLVCTIMYQRAMCNVQGRYI